VLYPEISQLTPDRMAKNAESYRNEGYRRFQLSIGGEPDKDIKRIKADSWILEPDGKLIAEANTGWLIHEADRIARTLKTLTLHRTAERIV